MSIVRFRDGEFRQKTSNKIRSRLETRAVDEAPTPIYVGSLMSRDLLTGEGADTAEFALDTLIEEDIHHLPVVDSDGRLVGILSDRDLLSAPPKTLLSELMENCVLTASEDTELSTAARAMISEEIHCLVVADQERKPVGIITTYDILDYLVEHPSFQLG